MQQLWKKIFLGAAIFVVFPLLLTAGISGKESISQKTVLDLESYLPILLCRQISWEYELETCKAQAVLARSSLYRRLKENQVSSQERKYLILEYQKNQRNEAYQQAYKKMCEAVETTRGQVLLYENTVCFGIYHKVSAGSTRAGIENLMDTTYGYLECRNSDSDISSKEYLHGHYFSKEALEARLKEAYPDIVWSDAPIEEQLVIVERDESDYVTRVKAGDTEISGEELRMYLHLSSSNFTIQESDGKLRFLCKGLGHGMGMSQYGANEMAKDGNTYLEILTHYFPKTTVQKIHLQA